MQISCKDHFDEFKPGAPSVDEQNAVTAALNGHRHEAIRWFDQAIIADPRRGARVFQLCCPLEDKTLRTLHHAFYQARHKHSLDIHEQALSRLFRRNPQLTDAQIARLKADVNMFSAPPYTEGGTAPNRPADHKNKI